MACERNLIATGRWPLAQVRWIKMSIGSKLHRSRSTNARDKFRDIDKEKKNDKKDKRGTVQVTDMYSGTG